MLKFRSVWRWVTLRRLVQISLLLAFLGLVVATQAGGGTQLPSVWLKVFFAIDPFLLIATGLAAHAVPALLWASLGLIAVTLVFGRVFCGWACPLGTLHALAGRLLFWIWPDRRRRDHWSPWQRTKYLLLAGLLVMALFGSHWGTIFDPLVLLYRTTTTAILPAAQWSVQAPSTAIYHYDPETAPAPLPPVVKPVYPLVRDYVSEPAYEFLRDHVFGLGTHTFLGSGLILGLFLVTLALNRYRPRFWCRYLCPLGALLGIFSLRPLVRRAVRAENCNQCDLCGMSCQGAATARAGRPVEGGRVPGLSELHGFLPPRRAAFHGGAAVAKGTGCRGPWSVAARGVRCGAGRRGRVVLAADCATGPWGAAAGESDPPARLAPGERVSAALHGVRDVHQDLPDARFAAGAVGSRTGGALDASAGPAFGLVRVRVYGLHAHLSDRGDPTADGRAEETSADRAGLVRTSPAVFRMLTAGSALSARSTVPSPTKRSTWSRRKSSPATAKRRFSSSRALTPAAASAAASARTNAPCETTPASAS